MIGYDPTARHAGPSQLVAGRKPGPGEATIDRQAADQLGVQLGDRVRILGRPLTLVGLPTGGTNIANTTVFITTADFARLRGPAQAYPGEVVLIMGPSGSGKTTLLLMLGAMLRPTAGVIEVDGLDIAHAPERRLPSLRAHRFGFVFQDFNLLSALTVAENVELACNLAGVTGRPARKRARALLQRVGLGRRLGFRPEQLSGGEKQRVAIARALANDPPLILADEPTANLDSAIGRDVARLLRQLATEDGRAVVIVSHDARLTEIADRVLWLEDGTFRELTSMATDPVCGMAVPQHDHPHLQVDGVVWWFCSTACREEFAADPGCFAPTKGLPRERSATTSPTRSGATTRPQLSKKDQTQSDIL